MREKTTEIRKIFRSRNAIIQILPHFCDKRLAFKKKIICIAIHSDGFYFCSYTVNSVDLHYLYIFHFYLFRF